MRKSRASRTWKKTKRRIGSWSAIILDGNGAKFVLEPVCVSAPGRICLAGEKLDWTGGASIACAVDELRVYVSVSDRCRESTTSVRSYSPFHVSDEFTAD